ncbi:MAG: arsenic efflux protein [Deltaproteobacteria bacterium]|nr:arsenic efflux protein [Deltaproteobacteria bacterium]
MEIFHIFKHALTISFFVFVMMLLVDFIDTATKKSVSDLMGKGPWRQYTLASFLGSTPGCLGAFMNVSLYVRGMISFGALVGGMIATSGDEAFVMLSQFPGTALALIVLLFVSGIFFAWISDRLIKILRITPCEPCTQAHCDHCIAGMESQEGLRNIFHPTNLVTNFQPLSFTRFLLLAMIISFLSLVLLGILGPSSWDWKKVTFIGLSLCSLYITVVVSEHYLNSHIWEHIIKKHLFRVFLWSFGALFFVHWGLNFWNLDSLINQHMLWVFFIGALLAIIPESGPHLIFVMMYAQGLIPFSILFTTSFIQDGHGMLPMLSYNLKDAVLIKVFNLVFGLAVGGVLISMGL